MPSKNFPSLWDASPSISSSVLAQLMVVTNGHTETDNKCRPRNIGKKSKVFPYSLPSVGPGADPGIQAVSPQVT